MKKNLILIAFFIIFCTAIITSLFLDPVGAVKTALSGDVQAISEMIYSAGAAAILISILLNTVISVLGVIPSFFLTMANIVVFGVYGGFLISWAGEVTGSVISFLLYRGGVRAVLKIPPDHWQIIRTISHLSRKKQIYFLIVVRLAPFFPSGAINLLGALTSIPLSTFFIATALGKFPALLLEAAFSYNIITVSKNYVYLGITVLAAILMYFMVKKEFQRLRKTS